MKFQRKLLVVLVAVLGISAIVFIRSCASEGRAVQTIMNITKARERLPATSNLEAKQGDLQALLDSKKHPMALYGKVVDQFGEAVQDARVKIWVYSGDYGDKFLTESMLKTDKEGRFSITGVVGVSITASAIREGYLNIPSLSSISSSASLSYSGGDGAGDRHSVPSNPVILNLLKIGFTEPMVYVKRKRWKLPLDGTPRMIALNSEKGQGIHKIEFRFTSDWNKLPKENERSSKLYDWSLEIRVPSGGLIWDESDVKFEAPASGYKEVVRYKYLSSMPRDAWKQFLKGRYFVKFADNTFGRIQFDIAGNSDFSPLAMQSWLNLTPGSRNLATEYMIINVMESVEPNP